MNKFIPIETVLSFYDDRYFYYIPGFNGYEVSNDGIVRSMKHYKKYPFGILIKPRKNKKGIVDQDPVYELSNNQNERVSIRLSQIMQLARENPYHVTGYPRRMNITDIAPRNQRCFIKKKIKYPPVDNTHPRSPRFTIICEEEYPGIIEFMGHDVICPVESLDGGEQIWRRKL